MRMLRLGVVCAIPLLLLACGGSSKSSGSSGGGGGGGGTTPVLEEVGGLVSKGPVAGATINVYRLNANGTAGARVAGPIQTDSDGNWSAQIDAAEPRPLAVVSTGGSYTDEATGDPVTAGELNSFLPEGAETVAVTPLTDLLVQATREHLAANPDASVDEGLSAGRNTLAEVLSVGFDPLVTVPANPADTTGADAQQLAYAAVLGGLSQLANNVAPGADPFVVIKALVSDMTDGAIDGQAGGEAVAVGEDELQIGGNTLADAIGTFAQENTDFAAVAVYVAAFSSVGENGSVSPQSVNVLGGGTATFTLTPGEGYNVSSITGCDGTLEGNTYTTGTINANCAIDVSFALNEYAVATQAGTGGGIAPEQRTVVHGDSTSFEINPDVGYSIANVTGCDGTLENGVYTTGTITGACTVSATFAINSYTVSVEAGANGAISPTSASVNHGSSTAFTVTPDTGYEVAGISGCEGALNGNTYTTGTITAACSISATFALRSYSITASAGTGGSIDPASTNVTHGSSTSFTLGTDTGYEIASVTGCGGSLEGNTYTTGTITGACSISATFSLIQIAVSTSAGANGSISPASRSVAYGNTTTFTLTPDQGYQIAGASGCGGALNGATYTTGAITSACTVTASFVASETPPTGAVWDQFNWDEANWQ